MKAKSDISPEAVSGRLTTGFVGRNFLYYPSVSSTMDVARKVAKEGAKEGTVIVAEEQTIGRARLGRAWINPPGVLAVSIILSPEMGQLIRLSMIGSLATSRCIEKATGLKTTIKWPNDVLVKGKKISGILLESALRGQSVDWAVIGIGINVNFDPNAYPEIADIATSLSVELDKYVSPLDILIHLLTETEQLYLALRRDEPVYQVWRDKLETLGKTVQVKTGDDVEKGYAESVDEDGALMLRRSDGSLARIVAGEVTLRT
ncbi:MAG TPA: biotin--[acetyl-CoA-carboxylase] ligase [Dehalococcoidia bacterium]|nr:biotin--[acetyl-CoA-carboxylase] ligase [Dehalococcoidia bacterium]